MLRQLRGDAGLTQEELAAAAGLSPRSVSDLERGIHRTARRDTTRLLADALGLSEAARARFEQAARGSLPIQPVTAAAHAGGGPAWPSEAGAQPRQLPAAVPHFSGRSTELATLGKLVGGAVDAVVVAVISGTAGAGKTTLAVRFAHEAAKWFPDGQLYVDLRGFGPGGHVMDPGEAAGMFLDALGVSAHGRPVSIEGLAGLYRSLLAGRRVLVVLDNARDSDQVRPLLPGAPGCFVLVTSRSQLPGLIASGAHPVTLSTLAPAEARALLASRLGWDQVAAQPEATDEVISACAGLPLAMAIVASRAEAGRGIPLHAVAAELADGQGRLDALAGGEAAVDVRAVLSWSYDALGPGAARLFRLLGLHPGPDISVPAAASLAGVPVPAARRLLAELAQAGLADELAPGRLGSHDLLRGYAAELAKSCDSAAERGEATGRLLDHYLHDACAAYRALYPYRGMIALRPPRSGTALEAPVSPAEALAWFDAERPAIVAAVQHAAAVGYDVHAWQLAWAVSRILRQQGRWLERAATSEAAVAAASRLGDPVAQAHSHFGLGLTCIYLGRPDEARTHLRRALVLYRQVGDRVGQAHARTALGGLTGDLDRHVESLAHYRKALALYIAAGDRFGQAISLNNIGWASILLGDHHTALARCQQALAKLEEFGDRYEIATTWYSLGVAHHFLGRHQQAAGCYREAISLFHNIGNAHNEGLVLIDLGDTLAAGGESAGASLAWQQALAILDGIAHPGAATAQAKLAATGPARQV
jgi:tetratricopeptide (TPR) repeat protein/transcriptional regulator with XRE-family HTH domain